MPKYIRNTILSIFILGTIFFSILGCSNDSTVLSNLHNFSDNPKIDQLLPTFLRTVWHFVALFILGILLCFWKVDSGLKVFERKQRQIASKGILYLFATIVLGGILVRLNLLFEPITYDEAFTYNQYASQRWSTVLSSYTYPNNQIFHTVLAKISVSIFGVSEWALRLPSFLFSLGTIFLAFNIGRITNVRLGVVFAFILAFMPVLIDYGALARGYSIVLFLGLFLWKISLDWEHRNRVDDLSQLLFISIGAISIWTIPIAVLPIAIILLRLKRVVGLSFIARLTLSIGLLSVILYAPVILLFGWKELISYPSMPEASYIMLFNHHLAHGIEHIYYVFILEKEILLWGVLPAIYIVVKKPAVLKEYALIFGVVLLFLLLTKVDPPARVWIVILPFLYFPVLKSMLTEVGFTNRSLKVISFLIVLGVSTLLILQSDAINVMRDFRMDAEKEAVLWMLNNEPTEYLESEFPSDAGVLWYQHMYDYDLKGINNGKSRYIFKLKLKETTFESLVVKKTSNFFILENTDFE